MTRLQILISLLVQFACVYSQLLPENAPDKSQDGQAGTNKCGTQDSDASMCQNSYLNSIDDFCLYAPPKPGAGSVIGNTERIEVAWCLKGGKGTRLIPDGTIFGAHFIQTPDYVQVTGTGNLTRLNVPAGDAGGELDPHGADGNGNPVGGLVFSSAFGGQLQQIHEWTNFMSDSEYCFRACKPGPRAAQLCQHIYDVMGCGWNMPGDYGNGYDTCQADTGEPMGVYGGSTFFQGQPATPPPHPAPSSSSCATTSTIGNGLAAVTSQTSTATATASSSGQSGASQTPSARTSSPAPSATNSASSASRSLDGLSKLLMPIGSVTVGALAVFSLL